MTVGRLPVVALVGRPNVGKSTLFNRLAQRRISIVEDTPGVTRDRLYAEVRRDDYLYTLIDTGGFEPKTDSPLLMAMRRQTQLGIDEADVVIFWSMVKRACCLLTWKWPPGYAKVTKSWFLQPTKLKPKKTKTMP
ncbi:MAG: hypothetical protein CMH56_14605 [Myxococcales bacterium]|nr:hypothetical protein [Myxococcales bacterium]